MSCFCGKTKEYPYISLDRFDGDNLNSSVYFLSHCHSDHMVGLSAPEFTSHLSETSFKLYCHPVTKGLLLGMTWYEHLRPFVETLEADEPHVIQIPGTTLHTITVTLIPAGHCPGSVMFLLQGENGTVLYTGDFRYHVGETEKLSSLFSHDRVLTYKLDSIYLDTTFFLKHAKSIPSRQSCRDQIIQWTSNWLERSPSNIVHVFSRSNYGYEFLMVALAKHFKTKVHVTESQYQRYRFIPTILGQLTTSSHSTRIHFCKHDDRGMDRHKMPCNTNQHATSAIFQIVPSVMYFTRSKITPDEMVVCENERTVRICYSSHSSYEEILDFMTVLRPTRVYPNVQPNSSTSLEELREKMQSLLTHTIISTRKVSSVGDVCPSIPQQSITSLWGIKFKFRKRAMKKNALVPAEKKLCLDASVSSIPGQDVKVRESGQNNSVCTLT